MSKIEEISHDGKIDASGAPSTPYYEREARTREARDAAGVTNEPFEDTQTKDTRSNLERGEALAVNPEQVGSDATEEQARASVENSAAEAAEVGTLAERRKEETEDTADTDTDFEVDVDFEDEAEVARFEDEGGTPAEEAAASVPSGDEPNEPTDTVTDK